MSPEALELRAALATIACAAELLRDHDDLFTRYLREAQHMDSVGPILDPTLWMNPQRQRIDAVYRAWPRAIRRADVAEALSLSPTASTTGVYIGAVAAYGLIYASAPGEVRAADWLFPEE